MKYIIIWGKKTKVQFWDFFNSIKNNENIIVNIYIAFQYDIAKQNRK